MKSPEHRRNLAFVKEKQKLTSPEPDDVWTRPETYLGVLLRTHSFRRAHREKPRTQPEAPRAMLSTIPFLILLALLAVLAVAIMIIAFPGNQPVQKPKPPTHQPGVAERGWFQEAQKEMHR